MDRYLDRYIEREMLVRAYLYIETEKRERRKAVQRSEFSIKQNTKTVE